MQDFWTGELFHGSEEEGRLAMSLGRVLVHLMGEEREAFLSFVRDADYLDAGQNACRKHLSAGLEDMVARFLGDGPWAPDLDHLAGYFDRESAAGDRD
jgi:hypothetical protein